MHALDAQTGRQGSVKQTASRHDSEPLRKSWRLIKGGLLECSVCHWDMHG
jgi:hypothetical protein